MRHKRNRHKLSRDSAHRKALMKNLSRQLFEEHRFTYLQLLSEALATAELDVERRFVWTAVTRPMLERHGVTLDEVEGLIDILRRTTEAEVTCEHRVLVLDLLRGATQALLGELGDVARLGELVAELGSDLLLGYLGV